MFHGLFGHGSAWALPWSISYQTPPVDRNVAPTKSFWPLAIPCYWQKQVFFFFMLMRNQKPSGWKPFVFMKAADTQSSSPDLLHISSDPPHRKMILKHFQIWNTVRYRNIPTLFIHLRTQHSFSIDKQWSLKMRECIENLVFKMKFKIGNKQKASGFLKQRILWY